MKFETLNYIYNLLTKEVDTTRTLQQHTFKNLCEAEHTEDDEKIEMRAMEEKILSSIGVSKDE